MKMKKLSKNEWVAVSVSFVFVTFLFIVPSFDLMHTFTNKEIEGFIMQSKSTTDLAVYDILVGEGEEVKEGDQVAVHYKGMFVDGIVFSSSYTGNPFVFVVGSGTVIKGWDEGLLGMREGGARVIVVPPSLGYGSQDRGPIPGNSTLVFEIDLIEIITPTEESE